MSNVDDDNDLDENGETDEKKNAPAVLRKQNSKLNEQLAEMQKQLEKFQAKDRAASIAEHLESHKASKKLAKYVERDLEGEPTSETVLKWLQDEGELFGWSSDSDDSEEDFPAARDAGRISAATTNAPPAVAGWSAEKIRAASLPDLIAAGIISG